MKYYKLPLEGELDEYYAASGDSKPFWWYSYQKQYWIQTTKGDPWIGWFNKWFNKPSRGHRINSIIEVSKLEVLVVVGEFP